MSWLHEQRLEAVQQVVRDCGARTLIDLGCGDGDLLTRLIGETRLQRIVGLDISQEALYRLRTRLDAIPPAEHAGRVELVHGSMTEPGPALSGFDCALLIETIEHLDPGRLSEVERALFARMRPATVVITTPNAELNPVLGVPSSRFRHPGHRFEWGRARFRAWAEGIAQRNGYRVRCSDLAGQHPLYGGASQMAVFTRLDQRPDLGDDSQD